MAPFAPSRSRHSGSSQAGFTLLGVILLIAVMNIFLGVAVARWSFVNQRDREVELIWRGEQYSRALKCYLEATGVPPTELEDLVEENCIRRLYTDPMSSSGEWKILRAADLGESATSMLEGLLGGASDELTDDDEFEANIDEEAEGVGSRMRGSSLLDRLRERRSKLSSPSGQEGEGGSRRFGSRLGAGSGQDAQGAPSGSSSQLGQGDEGSGAQSLRARAEGRLSERLAARNLTGGRGRINEADLMAAILGVVTSGSGEAIRAYNEKRRYEDWFFTLVGNPQQDPPPGGLPPGAEELLPGGTEIRGETEQRQSRFRRPSLRRGG